MNNAEYTVLKVTNISDKTLKVWWNKECSDAVHVKKALNKARRSFDQIHYLDFKQKRAEAQRCIERVKKAY